MSAPRTRVQPKNKPVMMLANVRRAVERLYINTRANQCAAAIRGANMRRIETWHVVNLDHSELREPGMVKLRTRDYRLLLRVARAADKWRVNTMFTNDADGVDLILAVDALNKPKAKR